MAAGLLVPWEPEDVDELAERAGFGEAPLPAGVVAGPVPVAAVPGVAGAPPPLRYPRPGLVFS